jgi:Flp pilus assembly protein TadD
MKPLWTAVIATFALGCLAPALAAPSEEEMRAIAAARADYERGRKAIDRMNWKEAIVALESAARLDPQDPEFQDLLGFSYRNAGNMEAAFRHYGRALELNPRHRGAHEYVGRAYLMVDKPEKAIEHLRQLEKVCPDACKERDMLKRAIDEYPWPANSRMSTNSY